MKDTKISYNPKDFEDFWTQAPNAISQVLDAFIAPVRDYKEDVRLMQLSRDRCDDV